MSYTAFSVNIMSVTPVTREKRERESPGTTSPLYKQTKMADSDTDMSPSAQSSYNDRLDKMMELLTSLKKGQESLQKVFDSKIEKLRRDVLSTIDDKIKSVKVDIDLQFAALEKRIGDLDGEMNSLRGENGLGVHNDTSVNNSDITVIATNVPVRHDRSLLDTAKALISALGDDVSRRTNITDVRRCSDRNTGKPPLLKIAFENVEQKIDVLRAKKNLKASRDFKNVYLRSSKNHTERILELNAKTLLSELPSGNQFRVTANGRIVKKDNSNPDDNPNAPRATTAGGSA